MFTGLVKDIGFVKSVTTNREGKLLTIKSSLSSDVFIDDSVSVNGACQTVISCNSDTFTVQSVGTTLKKTTLSSLGVGHEVNLELALRLSDRLGGHLVQGHVNGMAIVDKVSSIGNNYVMTLKLEENLLSYVVKEGSVTLDGVSLTVSNVDSFGKVEVSVIPHTWFHTTFKNLHIGDKVNVEVDIIAKYVENLLKYQDKSKNSGEKTIMTQSWLEEQGY